MLKAGGTYVIVSVNSPNFGWFEDYVVSSLLESIEGTGFKYSITVHSFSGNEELESSDSEPQEGAEESPYVYVIEKCGFERLRRSTTQRSDPVDVTVKIH